MLRIESPLALPAASFATEDQEMEAGGYNGNGQSKALTYTNFSAPLPDRYLYSIVRQNSLTAYFLSVELLIDSRRPKIFGKCNWYVEARRFLLSKSASFFFYLFLHFTLRNPGLRPPPAAVADYPEWVSPRRI